MRQKSQKITKLDELIDTKLRKHITNLLSYFDTSDYPNKCILFQSLTVTQIPVLRVYYTRASNSEEKSLVIIGNEKEVYFEGKWNFINNVLRRDTLVSINIILIATIIISIVIGSLWHYHKPNEESSDNTYLLDLPVVK